MYVTRPRVGSSSCDLGGSALPAGAPGTGGSLDGRENGNARRGAVRSRLGARPLLCGRRRACGEQARGGARGLGRRFRWRCSAAAVACRAAAVACSAAAIACSAAAVACSAATGGVPASTTGGSGFGGGFGGGGGGPASGLCVGVDAGTAAVRGAPAAGGPPAAGTGDGAVDPGAVAAGVVARAVDRGAAAGGAAAGACAPAAAGGGCARLAAPWSPQPGERGVCADEPGAAGVSTGALGPMNQTAGPPRGGSIGMPFRLGSGLPTAARTRRAPIFRLRSKAWPPKEN